MAFSLAQLAQLVDGTLHGDGELILSGAAILRDAQPGEITYCEGHEHARQLQTSAASAVLLPVGMTCERMPYITVDNVAESFTRIVYHYRPARSRRNVGISPAAHVSRRAQLGEDVQVHPLATIGDDVTIGPRTIIHAGVHIMAGCQIAEDVTIFPGAVLYEDTVVGPRCIIHAGAVLGAYGFGYETKAGRHELSPQLGYVVLESDVELGACTTIDRGTYGPTLIGEGTKVDNQVQIAHNCRIGRHNILCSQVGIAGSTTTGDYVVMAGQVGVKDHVHIGDQATLGAKAGVASSVPAGETYLGIPAAPIKEQKLRFAAMTKLPELRKEFRELQKQVEELVARADSKRAA
jgi:UDP-3-O-[3-hydroxymyristoyl] glucosamine N-acyltransferase